MSLFTRSVRFTIRYFALGLVLAGVLLSAGVARAEPDLLQIATKLVPESVSGTIVIDHPWLSDHQVLHNQGDTLRFYDTQTKVDMPLPKLSQEVFEGIGYLMIEASPCGNYIAWNHSGSGWETADTAGYHHIILQAPIMSPVNPVMSLVYWCSNGRNWVRFDDNLQQAPQSRWIRAAIYDVRQSNRRPVVYAIPTQMRDLDVLAIPSATTVIARIQDKSHTVGPKKPTTGKDDGGSAGFMIEIVDNYRPDQTVSAWNLSTGTKTSQWTIHLPGEVREAAASPDGKRLAWLVASTPTSAGMSIWVSNPDGTDLHEVGTTDDADISEIQWVPGDKAVSFHCDYWLYEVPAP